MNKRAVLTSLAAVMLSITLASVRESSAQEFTAKANIRSRYDDTDITPTPPAHVEGDTSPGTAWIRYDVTTGDGFVDAWHQLYSCCVDQGSAVGTIRIQDLQFSTPGGTGGTATVSMNLRVEGDTDGSCNGGSLNLKAGVTGGLQDLGTWDAGEPPCGSTVLSSGMFAGNNGGTISGIFTTPNFTVPLDTPVTLELTATGGTGSYQQVSTLDIYVSFPEPASGMSVFNLVSAPESTTVSSNQGDITDNVWGGGYQVVGVGSDPAPPRFTLSRVNPNPSTGLASLDVSLPGESRVRARVFELNGRLVADVFDGILPEGRHRLSWRAGRDIPSGIYFLKLRALGQVQSRRVILVH